MSTPDESENMNCIKPNINAKKYQAIEYRGWLVQPHPNAASAPIYGVRKPGDALMTAGPFATAREAKVAIDALVTAPIVGALEPSDVRRAYSGKPGCGCGCRGTYRNGESVLAARNIGAMRSRIGEVGIQVDDAEIIFYLEDDKRYRWLYVERQAFESRTGLKVADHDARKAAFERAHGASL